MPIKIPNDLPAFDELEREGVQLIGTDEAMRQDVRPLQIALLNLMPDKPRAETQLARLLGASPLQIELTLVTTSSYRPNTAPPSHLQEFYCTWESISARKFDGLIVTGAPVELLSYEEVKYWKELVTIFDWSRQNTHSQMFICWGAQAALYHFHGVPKHTLPAKRFGIYVHYVIERHDAKRPPLMRGFDDYFHVPVSRHTEIRASELPQGGALQPLAISNAGGLCLLYDEKHRSVYMFNHLEYDTYTLRDEYLRDRKKGIDVAMPINYFPDDDERNPPRNRWRAYAHLLFSNWINEIYQTAPFEVDQVGDGGSSS